MPHRFTREAVRAVAGDERRRFSETHPRSAELAEASRPHFLLGVPMHWMIDWGTPFPLFVAEAKGATLTDADGRDYVDFCLGDGGAMFGHSPAPVAAALAAAAGRGLTAMLPSPDAPAVGRLLAERFGLPVWQLTATATDANRAAIRWARALTGRGQVLVFNGGYHGTVDDAFVRLNNGHTEHRPGLIGQQYDLTRHSVAVEFNDPAALEAALAMEDIACVLTEPALTNCGMVLPQPGFLESVRELTRRHGTLLILDETHTLSTAPGGWARQAGIEADLLTLGKAIAGGLPVAAYGMSEAVAKLAEAHLKTKEPGHSGLGTTLSANLFSLAALRANLEAVATPAAYQHMTGIASYLGHRLSELFALHHLPWCVTQIGARCEFQFALSPPVNGREAEAAMDGELAHVLHLFLLNRGVAITPFHNMMLTSPATTLAHVDLLVDTLDAAIGALSEASH